MPGTNDLGPFGAGVNPTTTEPPSFGDSGGADYTWFVDCSSPTSRDGTKFTAQWANRMMKYIRRACDGMGIARNEADSDRLLKAIQKADRANENIGTGAPVYKALNGTTGKHEFYTLKGLGGITISLNTSSNEIEVTDGGSGGGDGAPQPDILVRDEKTSGSFGGLPSGVNSWLAPRDLNTVVRNTISGASLASNALTLPAGTYWAEWECPFIDVGAVRTRLFNVTDSVAIAYSRNIYMQSGVGLANDGATGQWSRGNAYFTIAGAKAIRIEPYITRMPTGVQGMGHPSSIAGVPEIFSELRVWKVA